METNQEVALKDGFLSSSKVIAGDELSVGENNISGGRGDGCTKLLTLLNDPTRVKLSSESLLDRKASLI